MRKSSLTRTTASVLCLIAVFTVALLPSCNNTGRSTTGEIPRQLDKLSLVETWDMVAETADLQKDTAELGSLYLIADADGTIKSFYFSFNGRNMDGKPHIFFASLNLKDRIDIWEYEANHVELSRHPLKVFEELDKLDRSSLERGDNGLILRIDFPWGDIGYSHDYFDLFLLKEGKLLPLNELVFHTQTSCCAISVFKKYKAEEGSSATTSSVTIPPSERTSQIWFLNDDINKADIVEYLDIKKE